MAFNEMLQLIITANGSQAVAEMGRVGTAAKTQLGAAEKSAGGFAAGFRKNAGLIAAGALGIGLALKVSVDAYEEQRLADLKLQNSLKNNPRMAGESAKAFRDQASALQRVTVASDEQVVAAQAMLGTFRMSGDEIRGLTPLVVDYARKFDVDLVSAAKQVGKAMDGQIGALKRNGVTIDEALFKTDRYAAVLGALRDNAGGFAQQEGKTLNGQLAIMGNQFGELAESIGSQAVPVLLSFLNLANDIVGIGTDVKGALNDVGVGATATGAAIGTVIPGVGTLAGAAVGAAFDMRNAFGKGLDVDQMAADLIKVQKGQDEVGDSTRKAAAEFKAEQEAILLAKDAVTAFFGGQVNLSQAQTQVTERLDAYNKTLADGTATATERQTAEDALKESYLAVSSAIQSNADANMDGTVSAKEQKAATDQQIYALQGMANSLAPGSPVRAFLDQYIMQLKAASGDFVARLQLQMPSNFRMTGYGPEINIGLGWRPVAIGPNGQVQMRAAGGPVAAGGTYLVGERGPELLQMGRMGGNITPNHALGGGTTVNVQITAPVGADRAAIGREIQELLDAYGLRRGSNN